ncbi:unnamed protein product [Lactuca virosa]|uniref:Uncharacterized protein n=1 Tax=Lactuca virosa TaxID=75947 RepID=A0AAU9MNS6_9ASTR|nr:unnamed protein product [Lactuca virosa]
MEGCYESRTIDHQTQSIPFHYTIRLHQFDHIPVLHLPPHWTIHLNPNSIDDTFHSIICSNDSRSIM